MLVEMVKEYFKLLIIRDSDEREERKAASKESRSDIFTSEPAQSPF